MTLSVPMTHDPDCCISILTDIDGSLVLVSCTTISVYVNLSKNMLQKERAVKFGHLRRGGFTSFAAAKVQLSWKLTKLSRTFFKKQFIFTLYTLYIISAREENQKKCLPLYFTRGFLRNPVPSEWTTKIIF